MHRRAVAEQRHSTPELFQDHLWLHFMTRTKLLTIIWRANASVTLSTHRRARFGGERRAQVTFARRAGNRHDESCLCFQDDWPLQSRRRHSRRWKCRTKMPSSFASRRAIANASSLETCTHSTICGLPALSFKCKILRNKARARALNLVRAGLDRLAGERLRNDRRIFRLNRDGLERRLASA